MARHRGGTCRCQPVANSRRDNPMGACRIRIVSRDNGVGLSESDRHKSDSFGLIGMHERAQYLGGWLSIVGTPGKGTCLSLHLPLEDWVNNMGTDDGDSIDRR